MKNDFRQKFHLEPLKGWLNDPNGLSFFNGSYHVYFQYAPDDAFGGGEKCWGHWQSDDLLSWKFTGTVLRPDIPEDRNGVYSGCGYVEGETLRLFYTGNVKEDGEHDYVTSGRGANVIMVTTQNGHDMSEKKVLLRNSDYPPYCSCHVRDPKIWKEANIYRMVLGARTRDDKGCVLFYTSPDLENWSFEKAESIPDFGYMWECPDFFRFGGKSYLSISPQGLKHGEYTNQNVYSSGYFKADGGLSDFEEWDYGFDFYAPQTFEAPDGRRLLIGWMGIGDIPYSNPTAELGWQHCLTVPREISAAPDGTLRQAPINELEKLRKCCDPLESGMTAELPFEITATTSNDFSLNFSNYLTLEYHGEIFSLRFTNDNVGCGRTVRNVKLESCGDLHVLADTSSIEIYLDGGKKVMSSRFYPNDTDVELSFEGLSGNVYELDEMEVWSDGK